LGHKNIQHTVRYTEMAPDRLKDFWLDRRRRPQARRRFPLYHLGIVAPVTDAVVKDLQASASALGLPIEILRAGTGREIDAAFANLVQRPGGALLVGPDAFFVSRRAQIVTLAARHAVPAIYFARDFAEAGGLMSYGSNLADAYQQTGIYVGRVL